MEQEPRGITRFLTSVLNLVHREPRIRSKRWIYAVVVAGAAGAIACTLGVIHFNEGQEARQRLQVLQDDWLNSLTEDQKSQLRDAETRTGFLKTAPLAAQTMRGFLANRNDFIRTHEGVEIFERSARGSFLSPWEIGFGVPLLLFGAPGLTLAGLSEKPRTR